MTAAARNTKQVTRSAPARWNVPGQPPHAGWSYADLIGSSDGSLLDQMPRPLKPPGKATKETT